MAPLILNLDSICRVLLMSGKYGKYVSHVRYHHTLHFLRRITRHDSSKENHISLLGLASGKFEQVATCFIVCW